MCLICCNVRIKSARQSSLGLGRRPGPCRRNPPCHRRWDRIRQNTRQAETVTEGIATGGLVHGASRPGTGGVPPPSSNQQPAEGN